MDGPETSRALRIRKMHGLGNDFVVIDARNGLSTGAPRVTEALARAIGDRHRGVGFDQLAEILPGDADADVDIVFWNPDGTTAGACGNATRCVADLLMAETGRDAVALRTERGRLDAVRRADGAISVNMGAPIFEPRAIPVAPGANPAELPLDGRPMAVGMGNPHCVFFVEDAEAAPVETVGPETETHPAFPQGTNVEFVQILAPDRIRMRVWERGAGVTLACGSGACAAAVAAAARGLAGRAVTVELDGGALQIDWRDDGVHMAGPVAHVFEAELSAEFLSAAVAAT
ncbi:MAG: diaminopimelate epimerase [Pseudomonadota bacterium]